MLSDQKIPEVAVPTPECPTPDKWRCYNDMATEVEVLQFIHAVVRMLKPKVVIETGTYLAHGTSHIAAALAENGFGHVFSAEPDIGRCNEAQARIKSVGLDTWTTIINTIGENLITDQPNLVDFAFLDSNFDTRVAEMVLLVPKLSPNGVVA